MTLAALMTSFVMQYGTNYTRPSVSGDALNLLNAGNGAATGFNTPTSPVWGNSSAHKAADAIATIIDLVAQKGSQTTGLPTAANRSDVARYLAESSKRADPDSDLIRAQMDETLGFVKEADDPSLFAAIRAGTVKIVHAADLGLVYERRVEHFFTEDGRYTGGKATYTEQPGFNEAMMVTGEDGRLYDRATGDRAGRMQVSGIPFYLTWTPGAGDAAGQS